MYGRSVGWGLGRIGVWMEGAGRWKIVDRGRWTVGVEGGYGLWQFMRTRVDRGERVGVEEECRY